MSACGGCRGCSHSSGHNNQSQGKSTDFFVKLYIDIEESKDIDYYKSKEDLLNNLPGLERVTIDQNIIEILYDDLIITAEQIKKDFL